MITNALRNRREARRLVGTGFVIVARRSAAVRAVRRILDLFVRFLREQACATRALGHIAMAHAAGHERQNR
jgi:hypothetical protein